MELSGAGYCSRRGLGSNPGSATGLERALRRDRAGGLPGPGLSKTVCYQHLESAKGLCLAEEWAACGRCRGWPVGPHGLQSNSSYADNREWKFLFRSHHPTPRLNSPAKPGLQGVQLSSWRSARAVEDLSGPVAWNSSSRRPRGPASRDGFPVGHEVRAGAALRDARGWRPRRWPGQSSLT